MTTKLRAEGMNLKGVPTVTVVFGEWHPKSLMHIVGIFHTEDDAEAKVQEELAVTGELRRFRVWRSTFFVQ
jgi:hypothetical protein